MSAVTGRRHQLPAKNMFKLFSSIGAGFVLLTSMGPMVRTIRRDLRLCGARLFQLDK